jgi:hypothetical protein
MSMTTACPDGALGARYAVDADPAGVRERALEEPPVGVVPDARHEVGEPQREAPATGSLVGTLPSCEAAAGAGRHGLTDEWEAVDLDVDVGVGRTHDDDGRGLGIGGSERGRRGLRGE